MKLAVGELTGSALCYAACMAEMPHLVWGETIGIHWASDQIVVPALPEPHCYSPALSAEFFLRIVERERIDLQAKINAGSDYNEWLATCGIGQKQRRRYGPTPQVAALRVFVAMKLGNEIELPEGLHLN